MFNGTGLGQGIGVGQVITPAIVTPGTTCICIPPGRCTTSPGGGNDGSGVIDIRIVTGVWLNFF